MDHGDTICGAEAIDDKIHLVRFVCPFSGIVFGLINRETAEESRIATGRGTPDAEFIFIDVILVGVGAKEANGGFDILEEGRSFVPI